MAVFKNELDKVQRQIAEKEKKDQEKEKQWQ